MALEVPGPLQLGDQLGRLVDPVEVLGQPGRVDQPRAVLGPRALEGVVEAQPLADRQRRPAVAVDELADGSQGQTPALQLGDELQALDVAVVVEAVAPPPAGAGQDSRGLVVADGPRRDARTGASSARRYSCANASPPIVTPITATIP